MKTPSFSWRFLLPRYWPVWLSMGLLMLLAALPWALQRRLGDAIGALAHRFLHQRRCDTQVNLRLCFPEWSDAERDKITREVFIYAGRGILETANAWFWPLEAYRNRIHFEGLELIKAAAAKGRGVLLLGAHYSSLDFGGALCSLYLPIDTVFRPQNNKLAEYLIRKRRRRVYGCQIDHDNMRGLARALKSGDVVWYTPDQDYGLRQGVFAPFFGVQAATITTPSRLARINDSIVMFVHFYVQDDGQIQMIFLPGPEGFPSGDAVADATAINHQLEAMIRRAPGQYMWFHRRFKTRPAGEAVPYMKKRRELRQDLERCAQKDAEKLS